MTEHANNTSIQETLTRLEERYSAHNYHPLDVIITRGEGVWLWDIHGNKYLDFLAAYSAVNQGHGHPKIVEALREQAGKLCLTSRAFRNDLFAPLCEKLSKLLGYEKVLMMNSGAEAVETAIKAARKWGYQCKGVTQGSAEILVFDGNFHGRTSTIVSFSTDRVARDGYGPFASGFKILPYGELEAVNSAFAANAANIVAILVEPVQGEGGVIIPSKDFLPGLRKLCDQHEALLICDEIQSGLGRAGSLLAQSQVGVRADCVTIGKALSGGLYPVSAFLADDRVMSVFSPGTHGSTFGGSPLACAVANAALDVIVDEDLPGRAERLGRYFAEGIHAIGSPHVKEIRALGLWIGVELQPGAGGARRFCESFLKEGMLCKETHEHTIRFAPPLVITQDELDWALVRIKKVLG